jgi:acid phosphatase (class A)
VPGHGSYPAGHALIARLTAKVLIEVVPAGRHAALLELARRIGFNRVIAGLHYESDCDAGAAVADQIPAILHECATYNLVKNEIGTRNEWA